MGGVYGVLYLLQSLLLRDGLLLKGEFLLVLLPGQFHIVRVAVRTGLLLVVQSRLGRVGLLLRLLHRDLRHLDPLVHPLVHIVDGGLQGLVDGIGEVHILVLDLPVEEARAVLLASLVVEGEGHLGEVAEVPASPLLPGGSLAGGCRGIPGQLVDDLHKLVSEFEAVGLQHHEVVLPVLPLTVQQGRVQLLLQSDLLEGGVLTGVQQVSLAVELFGG